MTKEEALKEQFKKAVGGLKEVLAEEKNDIIRDSAIKRFEMCFDLAWKSVKEYVREKGVECYNPRDCFQAGFQAKLMEIADDKKWGEMLEKRNLTVHTYKEQLAEEVYTALPGYSALLEKLLKKLQ